MFLTILDYVGILVFAVTGGLVAARRRLDIIGFLWLAVVTGVGGGTTRDLILNRPVFWLDQPFYLYICLVGALATYFAAHWINRYLRLVLWLDAVGLAVFAVIGTQIAYGINAHPIVCLLMGVMTATLGGVFRDMLAGEPTLIMRREIYVTAAALGSTTYLVLALCHVPTELSSLIACLAGFGLRALALRYRLTLPGYRWLKPLRVIPARRVTDTPPIL